MNTTTPTPALIAAHNMAEADSLALYKLANLVKLAAFACEARRTLDGIHDALTYHPKAKERINQRVSSSNNWAEFDDVTGEVLQDVAMQMMDLSEAVSNRPFDIQELGGAEHE